MESTQVAELRQVAELQMKNASRYADARRMAGKAQAALDLMVAAALAELRAKKPNMGIEMARLMLIEKNSHARCFYTEWMENEAIYKGLEKILDAGAAKISMEQSFMKYQTQGEKYG